MIYDNNCTLANEYLEQLADKGFEGLPRLRVAQRSALVAAGVGVGAGHVDVVVALVIAHAQVRPVGSGSHGKAS